MPERTHQSETRPDISSQKRINNALAAQTSDSEVMPVAPTTRANNILSMQQRYGNAYVQRFIASLKHPDIQRDPLDDVADPDVVAPAEENTTPPDDSAAMPLAPTDPGKSAHPLVKFGSRGPAVEELQQKLNGNGATLDVDGIFGPLTRAAVRDFQTTQGIAVDGTAGLDTWNALDASGASSTVGRVERPWHETVGGVSYGMTSRYTWRITDPTVFVTVNLHFTGPDLTAVPSFLDAIRATWNRFDIVQPATGDSLDLVFNPQSVTSGGDNTVAVKQSPPGTVGRSNSSEWFADDPDVGQTASHEFGHMIGLEDEYQRTHRDYTRVVGNGPDSGAATGDAPASDIANQMNAALNLPAAQRVAACTQVISNHNLAQGDFADAINAAYRTNFAGTELVDDIVAHIPTNDQFPIVDPFSHSSGSIMGDPARHDTPADHAHPTQPRHVRQFAEFVTQAKGGIWLAQER